ncbi:hypothetical protein AVEN_203761-1 [Araneus ventricosus]|uniref:Uncharacterized protein n=1 Tax=Araneus ventricosus TaxID=182803 RepID=A0A4Y2GE07_ARAVE|nr:hypothetical protein AVEN_203761-1 [Araneus ventricosus]
MDGGGLVVHSGFGIGRFLVRNQIPSEIATCVGLVSDKFTLLVPKFFTMVWCGSFEGRCSLRYHPRHLTMILSDEVVQNSLVVASGNWRYSNNTR